LVFTNIRKKTIAQIDDTIIKVSEIVSNHQTEKTAILTQKTIDRENQNQAQYSE
jgi:hypothetical protein